MNSNRTILHLDLDAFYVSVEVLRNSRLRGMPLIIGGKSGRGVVAACSYEARAYGVHSAQPMKRALQLCPEAVVISGDMERYTHYSRLVTDMIEDQAPLFEKSSIDEFYLDLTGMDKYFGAYKWATELREKISRETGLPLSMGLSVNKLVAKVATNEAKPKGQLRVPAGQEAEFLAPMPVENIPMIGKKATKLLNDMGVIHVKSLQETPVKALETVFGRYGRALWDRAWGRDESPVASYRGQKSMSTESTFHTDSRDTPMMEALLTAMVEKLAFKLRKAGKLTSCIGVKLRYSNFETVSRQMHIPYTSSDKNLIAHALQLFHKLYNPGKMIRLVGVRLSKPVFGNHQISLFDDTDEEIRLFQAMDHIRLRYGAGSLTRASTLSVGSRVRQDFNAFSG